MQISLILAQQIAELFLILLIGCVLVKTRLLKSSDSRVLSVVMVYAVMPCVIINAFQVDYSPAVVTGLLYAFALAIALHALLLLLARLLRRPLRLDVIERTCIIYTNAGILVIPLVRALLGEDYVIYSCARSSSYSRFSCGRTAAVCSAVRAALSGKKSSAMSISSPF